MEVDEGIRKVQKRNFAYHCDEAVVHKILPNIMDPHQICDTKIITLLPRYKNGVLLSKKSPFRDRFAINLSWIREVGIVYKKLRHWKGSKPSCVFKYYFRSINLYYVSPLFLLLIIAGIISLLILLCEIYVDQLNKIH